MKRATTGLEADSPPDHEEVRLFYDNEYYASVPRHDSASWHARLIASRMGDLHGREVLDVACGTGEWLAEVSRRGARVAGVDISGRAVAQCRSRLPEAEIHEGVAEYLPFDDGRFDIVTCLGSLEHFLDQPAALREMRRVAKADANLLVLVPNAGFLTRRLGLYGGTGQVAIRETVRPLDEWEDMLNDAGIEVMARWRDLHPLGLSWIRNGPVHAWPIRAAQALVMPFWPIAWQYQVYFYGRAKRTSSAPSEPAS